MDSYNLWDEPWLEVMDFQNQVHAVSLTDLFEHAHQYQRISGEMATQDFATFRMVLAILQTTFMRYRTDSSQQPQNKEALHATWQKLWEHRSFPMEAIRKYRDEWKDRFNLYDDKAPFLQIPQDELDDIVADTEKHDKPGHFLGKTIKRTVSESGNKQTLFQPYSEATKNHLSNAELTRWLISLQGYVGTSDKVKAPAVEEDKARASKGWLFNLGGIYLRGDDLFETLMLNLILDKPQPQHPVWEWDMEEKTDEYRYSQPDDLASIYTNCSRLLNIDTSKKDVDVQAVQLANLDPGYTSIEPMTLWGKTKQGDYYPRTHDPNRSLWQSFGLLDNLPVKDEYKSRMPTIMRWFRYLVEHDYIDYRLTKIVAVGMTHATQDISNSPNGEAYDELSIQDELFKSVNDSRIQTIYNEVERTQRAVQKLRLFASRLDQIRNDVSINTNTRTIPNSPLVEEYERQAYFQIDTPFKHHIAEMSANTDLNSWINDWRERVRRIILAIAGNSLEPLESSDLIGVPDERDGSMVNIITIYTSLQSSLKYILEEVKS